MRLDQMLMGLSIVTPPSNDFEEKKLSKPDKYDLDKVVTKELKKGWLVKSRSHESEGMHGVILVRRKSMQDT